MSTEKPAISNRVVRCANLRQSALAAGSAASSPDASAPAADRRPEKVSALIGYIESGLGVKANITRAPITAGDVPMTYADVSHARQLLGYSPKVTLEAGVRRFLLWYSEYYRVELAAGFSPTRREAQELRAKYNINVSAKRVGGKAAARRQLSAGQM